MSWFNTIKNFLHPSNTGDLYIGERTPKWIRSFEQDLVKWEFPVRLVIINPVIVSGKVPCKLIKEGLGK